MPETIVKLPQLGESIAEGTIGRWLKQPGERIERDEPLVEVQTDKVNAEVPSPVTGVVQRILQPEGATVAIHTDIAVIGDGQALPGSVGTDSSGGARAASPSEGTQSAIATAQAAPAAQGPEGVTTQRTAASAAAAQPTPLAEAPRTPPAFTYDSSPASGGGVVSSAAVDDAEPSEVAGNGTAVATPAGERRFYTPVVLRMAAEHGLDLGRIEGSGLGGRVTRKDVERVIATGGAFAANAPAASIQPSGPPGQQVESTPADSALRALTPMRRAIAAHMVEARSTIPDAWSLVEVDVTNLVKLRASLLDNWMAREGFELTYLPFMIKAVLAGLREVPELNASWQSDGSGIRLHRRYNLGIAVSIEQGLVVPVLRDADQYSIAGLAGQLRQIVQKARAGKLAPDDLQGGTFTVNNPGSLGSIMSQPVVPVGQAGIVTMEAIVKRPIVTQDDAIAIRSMMNVCLSFDHRVLDGAQALRFLRTVSMELEAANFSLY